MNLCSFFLSFSHFFFFAKKKIQSWVRAWRARKAARGLERTHWDGMIGACVAAPTQDAAQSLARSFAFFFDVSVDSQRLVLMAALFRNPRVSGPLSPTLLPLLCGALSVEAGRNGASFAALIKLISVCTDVPLSSTEASRLLRVLIHKWRGPRRFHQLIGSVLSSPTLMAPLRMALLAVALRPFHLKVETATPGDMSVLRIDFTLYILAIPDLLVGQPPLFLAGVAAAVQLETSTPIPDAKAMAIVGNLALLIGAGHVESHLLFATGLLLRSVSGRVFLPVKGGDGDDAGSSSSSDEDDEEAAAAAALVSESAVLRHLSALVQPEMVKTLFRGARGHANVQGLCVIYGVLLEFWAAQREAIVGRVAFSAPEAIPVIFEMLVHDEASVKAFQAVGLDAVSLGWRSALFVLSEVYGRLLRIQSDDDFYGGTVLSLDALRQLVRLLCPPLVAVYAQGDLGRIQQSRPLVKLLTQLYERDCRKPFVERGLWLATELDSSAILQDMKMFRSSRVTDAILRDVPFFLPFLKRVEILRTFVYNDGGFTNDERGLAMGGHGVRVQIRRTHLMEDGFRVFSTLKEERRLKERLRITFIDANGLEEAGVDGGGIYKEFLNHLVTTAFFPNSKGAEDAKFSLFCETESHKLYPNPHRRDALYSEWYEFLGMVLGKAIYEGQLVELPLASFFLSKLLGKSNSLNDLASLDAELHRNLAYILTYKGDFSLLGLNFSLTEANPDLEGVVVERDLVPNGRNIAVTKENRIQYVYAMANYKLNVSIRRQCKSFLSGFSLFIRPFVARLFTETELQMLISGEEGPLNLAQWQEHCQYSGGYHPSQPIIREFWEVVASFTPQQQRKLLRFITSCSRPPLQGFGALFPLICIHKRDGGDEYLPTAATCMNLLKLPVYSHKHILRERLLYAIESDAGFDLS